VDLERTHIGLIIMHVALVTGTRPQIIKSAPVIHALEKEGVQVTFIHTGQHYDYELAAQFIEELAIKQPDKNLEVGSGTGVFQIREVMMRLADSLGQNRPDYLVVPGDTNSALGAALTGFKMDLPTCHLESGLRSYDMGMQEEINRRLIDHGSAGLFAPTVTAVRNLESENVVGTVYHTGDTMYDILKERLKVFNSKSFQDEAMDGIDLPSDNFAMLTMHRRENVDVLKRLRGIIEGLKKINHAIVFPMHPRTRERLSEHGLEMSKNVHIIPPISYTRMMALVSKSSLLLTDSGGLQKEAYLLNTPCVTLRDNSEWVETIEAKANVLALPNAKDIEKKASMMWGKKLDNDPSVYGDGRASQEIVKILASGEIGIKNSVMIE
jgi:UDP-N-acetylglucosamine 2-epimerase